ncbi:MAG: response regulator [bacterium]|nr:response regulator [bacterium]
MKKLQILVVDDDRGCREITAEMLFELGNHEVTIAVNGQRALALVDLCHFDIMVTDRQMPGMFGEELICRAKKIRPSIKTVLMTGDDLSPEITAAINAAGTDAVLQKPFLMADLRKILEELFE